MQQTNAGLPSHLARCWRFTGGRRAALPALRTRACARRCASAALGILGSSCAGVGAGQRTQMQARLRPVAL